MDRGYCVGLREVGLRFLERGDVEMGLSFFAAGEKLLPGMEYGQLDMGIALMKAGRAAEAMAALEKVRGRDGAFPSGFLIGLIHLHLGDRTAARLSFDAALTAIEQLPDIQVARGEIAQVISTAAAYYREEGLLRQAERLEGDPRLRLPVPQAEPEETGGK
jgi:tetratricopeptide (TPR) repeat protein